MHKTRRKVNEAVSPLTIFTNAMRFPPWPGGVSLQWLTQNALISFGSRRPRKPPPAALRPLTTPLLAISHIGLLFRCFLVVVTRLILANLHHARTLRGPPALGHHCHRMSRQLLSTSPYRAITHHHSQMFGVTGVGLYYTKHLGNEGKKTRWNRDLWDRVSRFSTPPPSAAVGNPIHSECQLTLVQQSK